MTSSRKSTDDPDVAEPPTGAPGLAEIEVSLIGRARRQGDPFRRGMPLDADHRQRVAAGMERLDPGPAELRQRGFEPGMPVFIRIFKRTSELEVWLETDSGWKLFRNIEICNFSVLVLIQ